MSKSAIEVISEEIARINSLRDSILSDANSLANEMALLEMILRKIDTNESKEESIQEKLPSPYPNEGVQVGMPPSEALMAFIATNPGCTRKEIMSACESWCCDTKSKNLKNLISSTLGSAGFRKRITKKGAKFYVK